MIINPTFADMTMTMLMFGAVIGLSLYDGLKLEKSLIIATTRTVVQLAFVGYVITALFELDRWWVVVLALVFMSAVAARAGLDRIKGAVPGLYAPMWLGIVFGSIYTVAVVTGAVLKVDPWYRVDVMIPLGGMILGNAMNGGAIAADRLYSEIRNRRDQIETLLMLGWDYRAATAEARREAVRAALIPTINTMTTVGLVHLPGIMVGQMLGGVDPVVAAKYQIIIMLMVASSVTLTAALFTKLAMKRFFTPNQALRAELFE
ncbi:MAG: iron export ABC transporter permease subunit FetB [Nitrospinota bacterium]|nr:iron export ABC transporter permease subunit FetB [Nitrospinota bacterium]MDH5679512.1 iron export ABC transporter permease subunit FetB [Nitrospinota bacterium]MDH5756810.1 iron export ABC transporter permease subunit FetB [Nitrospinota bacterium]